MFIKTELLVLLTAIGAKLNLWRLGLAIGFGFLIGVLALVVPNSMIPSWLLTYGIPLLVKILPSWLVAVALLLSTPLAMLAHAYKTQWWGQYARGDFNNLQRWLVPILIYQSSGLGSLAIFALIHRLLTESGQGHQLAASAGFIIFGLVFSAMGLQNIERGLQD